MSLGSLNKGLSRRERLVRSISPEFWGS